MKDNQVIRVRGWQPHKILNSNYLLLYMWSLFHSMIYTQSVKFNFLYVVPNPGGSNDWCQATLGTKDSVMQINCKQLT